jgi:hypothetical protein
MDEKTKQTGKGKTYEYRQKWNRENQRRLATQVDQETADRFSVFCAGKEKTAGAILQAYVYACIGKTE